MMTNKIRTIFMGTPEFAVPALKALLSDDFFELVGVITQPDKPVGRKQALTAPPVKVEALKNHLPVWQPSSIRDYQLPEGNIDLVVVAAYAKIIPELMLNFPKYGFVNVHGSILPKYRGASCVQAAIANGDAETGVTIMKMDKGLDTGPIISQSRINIQSDDTAGSMFNKLADLGAKALVPALKGYIQGETIPEPQDDSKSSYAGMLKKEDGRINWGEDAAVVERFVRSRHPWPGAWSMTYNDDQRKVKINVVKHDALPVNKYGLGEIFAYEGGLAVQCGKNALVIRKIQLEGKKETDVKEFLRGHPDFPGKTLN